MRYFIVLTILLVLSLPWPSEAARKVVPQSAAHMQLSFAPVVKQTAPAVVNIYASKRVQVRTSPFLSDPFFGDFLSRFGGLGRTREQVVNSLGSGVIIDAEGLIITNNHVVGGQLADIRVILSDKREFKAEIVLTDPRTDLALLKVKGLDKDEQLPFIPIAEANALEVGDIVLAIGNPFGVGQTVTNGIVSALARTAVGVSDYEFFIQTDAAINPGNSGGALVNLHGELVGINTAIYSKSGGSHGIGFATPSIMAMVLLRSHELGLEHIVRPWLGASTQNITPDIAESLGLPTPSGVLVKRIFPDSATHRAGLMLGDVIIAVDGNPVAGQESLRFYIATKPLDSSARFTVLREGQQLELQVAMEPPAETVPRNTTLLEGGHPFSGAIIENLSPAVANELDINSYQGVVVREIQLRSRARQVFEPLDIIIKVNDTPVTRVAQLKAMLSTTAANRWTIEISRNGRLATIQISY